tara:strand:+ start:1559 stop:1699 length:141 start_codon:yes stop_codon:yes gene_type:complete
MDQQSVDFLGASVEILIDQLHSLAEAGEIEDAEAVADRIRELQEMQ